MKKDESTRRVMEIYNSVLDLPEDLVAPQRKFEVEAICKVTHVGTFEDQEYRMILFTDLLILSTETANFWGEATGIYRCEKTFDLKNLTTVRYDKGSTQFEFKYRDSSAGSSECSVAKYIFNFSSPVMTSQVADVPHASRSN